MSNLPTMADVAREAGVSLMTVSRVINHKEGVGEQTRHQVQAVIARLGYRPSVIARGLATRRTGTLGLVVPDNANPFFSEVARGAEERAYTEGYNVFLCNTAESPERELAVLQSLEEKRVDGLILCSSRLSEEQLCAALPRFPAVVLINRQLPDLACAGTLLIDDTRAGQLLTQHLLAAGHRVIGMVTGPNTSHSARQRLAAYRETLVEAGIPYEPALVESCLPRVAEGREAALRLLTAQPPLTALIGHNDLVAVGILQACAALGKQVPADLAVVGCDDIPLAAWVTPPLTTCRLPRYELGAQAVQQLLESIAGVPASSPGTPLQPELIIRASAPAL